MDRVASLTPTTRADEDGAYIILAEDGPYIILAEDGPYIILASVDFKALL